MKGVHMARETASAVPPRRAQLPEEAAAYIRERIISGAVKPGEFLRIEPIAEAMGISNTPVREGLLSLSSQGFEVKEMGERKLKGLENPEVIYSLYPHALAGRIDTHQAFDRQQTTAAAGQQAAAGGGPQKPAVLSPGSELAFDPQAIWDLWKVSLRLEMLCSSLEYVGGRGLQPPETLLMERMKQRGGEVTEGFVVNFMEHQISRIEVSFFFPVA
jgi:adenylate cyclase